MEKTFIEIYKDLASIDCSSFTEKKKDLTYLSWSHAWNTVASRYDTKYEVVKFDGKPYFFDESLGYYVETTVTIEGITRTMQLFVMDGANNAMTNKSYTYKTKFGDKTVEKATMFEINTAIMRCLTKNLAIFGLGINIYAGEDLPMIDGEGNVSKVEDDGITLQDYIESMKLAKTPDELKNLFMAGQKKCKTQTELDNFTKIKDEKKKEFN